MGKRNSLSGVPTELRDAVTSFQAEPGSKHWAKMVKVMRILIEQEAKSKRIDSFLEDSAKCSPGKARQATMLKIIPAPFVGKPLSDDYIEERLIKTRRLSRTKSIFCLCKYQRGKPEDVTRLMVLMFKTHDHEGRRVYGLFHDRKGDDYSSYCCDGEVLFTYCFSLPHLVEHVLTDKDIDAILHLDDGNL